MGLDLVKSFLDMEIDTRVLKPHISEISKKSCGCEEPKNCPHCNFNLELEYNGGNCVLKNKEYDDIYGVGQQGEILCEYDIYCSKCNNYIVSFSYGDYYEKK